MLPLNISRDSNLELLRLVCMLFIVCHHFCVHAVFPEVLDSNATLSSDMVFSTFLNGFLYVAVNCFILISGYYGVRLKAKSICNLYLTCAFYATLAYLFHIWHDGASIGKSLIHNSLLVFSHSTWWYISAYLILLLFSPILNAAIESMNRRQHFISIVLLLIMQVYFGNFWQHPIFDNSGYHAFQFITLYLIGRYIYIYQKIRLEREGGVICYCML